MLVQNDLLQQYVQCKYLTVTSESNTSSFKWILKIVAHFLRLADLQYVHNWQQNLQYYKVIAATVMQRNEVVMINFPVRL